MKFYLVTFDRIQNASYKPFHDSFVNDPRIINWWHHIKSCYVIATDMTANELSDHFTESARSGGIPTRHLIMEAEIANRQGMLPQKAWKWFKEL